VPRMNHHISTHIPATYATGQTASANMLDCSLGVNPFGCSPTVSRAFEGLALSGISAYPHEDALKAALARHWAPWAQIGADNLLYGNGSMGLLADINRLFLFPGARVFGIMPGFSAYHDDVCMRGATLTGQALTPDITEETLIQGMLEGIRREQPDMVYLENPNNPTGFALSLSEVKRIADLAEGLDIPLLVDEAYGDYRPNDQSAICLVPRFSTLMVTRTFSKGFGLAGLRIGYAVASPAIAENLKKIICIFNANTLGREAAKLALCDTAFVRQTIEAVRTGKAIIMGALKNIAHYPTSETTPIVTLTTARDVDLFEHLKAFGIFAVPGESFESLDRRCVRLILHRDVDALAIRLSAADKALGG